MDERASGRAGSRGFGYMDLVATTAMIHIRTMTAISVCMYYGLGTCMCMQVYACMIITPLYVLSACYVRVMCVLYGMCKLCAGYVQVLCLLCDCYVRAMCV